MPKLSRCTAAAAAALMLSLTLGACSDDAETAASNEAEACAAITSLRAEVTKIDTLHAQSSVDEVRTVRSDIADAYQKVEDALGDVADDRLGSLKQAHDDFQDGVERLDGDLTVAQALSSMQADAQQIRNAEQALASELSCT